MNPRVYLLCTIACEAVGVAAEFAELLTFREPPQGVELSAWCEAREVLATILQAFGWHFVDVAAAIEADPTWVKLLHVVSLERFAPETSPDVSVRSYDGNRGSGIQWTGRRFAYAT